MRKLGPATLASAASLLALACNAVLGLEEVERAPAGGAGAGNANAGSGGNRAGGGGSAGKASGGGTSAGGASAAGGEGATGNAGDAGDAGASGTSGSSGSGGAAGEASGGASGDGGGGVSGEGGGSGRGGDPPECEPEDVKTCRELYPELLGNCARGEVTCREDGTWGPCDVVAAERDSCDVEGDDADCDGTENGACPCVTDDTRPCGPETDDGVCEFGTSTCVDAMWAECEGEVLPSARDCQSTADNDCDGEPDNVIDDECPCSSDGVHQCVPAAPADWSGPMAIATASAAVSAPSCAGTAYERLTLSLFGELDSSAFACACACSSPASMTCGAINMQRATTSINCQFIGQVGDTPEYTNIGVSCQNVDSAGRFKPIRPTFSAGACTAQPSHNLEDAEFTRRMVACETNDTKTAGCAADQLCVPNLVQPLDGFCIYREGSHACPSGPYSARSVYAEDVADTRTCTPCGCNSPTGTCSGSVSFTYTTGSGTSCSDDFFETSASFENCVDLPSPVRETMGVSAAPATPSGSCTATGGAVQGGVTVSGEVTVCCLP